MYRLPLCHCEDTFPTLPHKKAELFWLTVSKASQPIMVRTYGRIPHGGKGVHRAEEQEARAGRSQRLPATFRSPSLGPSFRQPAHPAPAAAFSQRLHIQIPHPGRFPGPNSTSHYRARVQGVSLQEPSRIQTIPCCVFSGSLFVRAR